MIAVGSAVPAARVWLEPSADGIALDELASEGPYLLLFYLYDWSST